MKEKLKKKFQENVQRIQRYEKRKKTFFKYNKIFLDDKKYLEK